MVEIKITGTTPLEALASVTAFGWHCMTNPDVHAGATRVLEAEKTGSRVSNLDTAPAPTPAPAVPPMVTAPAAPAPAPAPAAPAAPVNPTPAPAPVNPALAPVNPALAPAPVAAAPVAGPQVTPPGNAPATAPVAAAPTYTVEQIGKAGADLVSQDAAKMPGLLALLQKYGVQAITQLKPEQLGAFATELRELGAKL